MSGHRWAEGQWRADLNRGPHQSMMTHVPFLREEFALKFGKGRWVVLPLSVAKDLPGLKLSPPVVKEAR